MLGQSVIPKQLELIKSENCFLQVKFILEQISKHICHFELQPNYITALYSLHSQNLIHHHTAAAGNDRVVGISGINCVTAYCGLYRVIHIFPHAR